MPRSLSKKLEKIRSQEQIKPHQWHGRVNYHSPRAAESWDAPDRLLSFDGQSREGAKKVMESYRQQVLAERGLIQPAESLQKGTSEAARKAPGIDISHADIGGTRLSPFEEAFRVTADDSDHGQNRAAKSWLRRLFSWR